MNHKFDTLFARLKSSPFRARFKLSDKDKLYIQQKGIDTIRAHCQRASGFCGTTRNGLLLPRVYQQMA